jgi:methylmalonyl-CoA epimerase
MTDSAAATLPFLAKGIDQVAILVPDLDEAVKNWHSLLGVGPWAIFTFSRPGVRNMYYRGKPANSVFRVAFGQVGPLRIELIQPLEGDSIYADYIAEHGYGMHHIGILTEDMQTALAQAKDAGLEVIQEGSEYGVDGTGHYAYFDTAEQIGMAMELIELPKQRAAPEAVYPPPRD